VIVMWLIVGVVW